MATTMKSNNAAIATMQQMLQERYIAELMFAIKMANPSKSMEGAVNYLCSQIQKSGVCMIDNKEVMNILYHYFDENEIEGPGKDNCNIVVSKPELSVDDKAILKEQAMEQYTEEQLRQIRKDNAPKPTTTAPKKGAEIDTIPNLFDGYIGLAMTDGNIRLNTLNSVAEYYQEGEKQRICVGTSK